MYHSSSACHQSICHMYFSAIAFETPLQVKGMKWMSLFVAQSAELMPLAVTLAIERSNFLVWVSSVLGSLNHASKKIDEKKLNPKCNIDTNLYGSIYLFSRRRKNLRKGTLCCATLGFMAIKRAEIMVFFVSAGLKEKDFHTPSTLRNFL